MTRCSLQHSRQGIPEFLNTLPQRDSVRLEEEHLAVQLGITTVKRAGFCNWLTERIMPRVISTIMRMVLVVEIHGMAERAVVNLEICMKIYNSIQDFLGGLGGSIGTRLFLLTNLIGLLIRCIRKLSFSKGMTSSKTLFRELICQKLQMTKGCGSFSMQRHFEI
ncbi:hypothetical protein WK90_16285 [Burkholderia cepacia]|nr:hypothetical protein WK83_28025 [Burkholderia cepacia]KVV66384.1 hypothetical protein WK85_28420 [Burkholderia cepacia]KVV69705.1 hypothetical protein WK84_16885 [Burkholderia cepacia]KVV71381.1 hypothetical protein WK86_34885 [Burkholderia cepacia]KVV83532.1 hypothetical protein WK87_23960 [Burkholderia cepacia]